LAPTGFGRAGRPDADAVPDEAYGSVLVFRDPYNIQLELFAPPTNHSRDRSVVMHTHTLTSDVTAVQDAMEIPGIGVLPVNAFLLRAAQLMLVDTGLPGSRDTLLDAVGKLIDLADLRWIWLSHPDRDHTGLGLSPQWHATRRVRGTGHWAGLLLLRKIITQPRSA